MNNNQTLFCEFGTSQLIKHGEELCGDSIVYQSNNDYATMILSDGLGSGVKANILATLTTKIISVMLDKGSSIYDVVDTLSETLPICSVRKLAYSTFSIGQFFRNGTLHLVEYDNPPAIFVRNKKVQKIYYKIKKIKNKQIKEAEIDIQNGDWLIFISDGEVHAGIGGVWNLGWSWDRIARFIETRVNNKMSADELAQELTEVANRLYNNKPGDDTSAAVVKIRYKRFATVMIGAPKNKEDDKKVVQKFISSKGKKIVCGGTTGNIVARELKQKIEVDLRTIECDVPPIGYMKGIDLCTEGIFTISKVLKLLRDGKTIKDIRYNIDGASKLLYELLYADEITFIIGQAMNPAHQNPNMPPEFELKKQITEDIATILQSRGKIINLEYY